MAKKPTDGKTKQTQMRLEPSVLAEIDGIAEYHTAETGVVHSRTDAVRVSVRNESKRIKAKKPAK
jgi:hypothetical protein